MVKGTNEIGSLKPQDNLRVSGQSNTGDRADFVEELGNGILVNVEGQVADEQGVALSAEGITVLLGTVGSAVLGVGTFRAGVGVVEVDVTAANILALHSLVGNLSRLSILEVDIAKATAAASALLGNDTSTNKAIERLECLVEGIIINAPGQAAGEEGRGSVAVDLGLLGRGIDLLIGLALLGRLSLLLLLLVGRRVVGVLLRVIAVRLGSLREGKSQSKFGPVERVHSN